MRKSGAYLLVTLLAAWSLAFRKQPVLGQPTAKTQITQRIAASSIAPASLPVHGARLSSAATSLLASVSEGVVTAGADNWHAAGYQGHDVKIAVLDRGFQGYTDLIASGDLPANVMAHSLRADGDIEAGKMHGSACAEIVYDMAPQAEIYLVNFDTDAEFSAAVDWVIAQDIQIVSCSVNWLGGEPFDGTGPVCQAVDRARDNDILWAQSAGDVAEAHWEGVWSDTDHDGRHNFTSDDEDQTLAARSNATIAIELVWDDAWGTASNDYDLYLYNAASEVVASSVIRQTGSTEPSESISYTVGPSGAGTYYLVIEQYSASRAAYLDLYSLNQVLEHKVSASSLLIPADAQGAVTVGAADWQNALVENSSSRGPTNDDRLKPELSGPDRVTLANYPGGWVGTSAAAPHVAGAAALVRGAFPTYSVTETLAYLTGRAQDRGLAGPDNDYGYGLLQLGDVPPPSTSTPTATASATSTPTPTATATLTASPSPTPSPSATPSATDMPTPTRTASATTSPSHTLTCTATQTATPSHTPSSTATINGAETTLTLQQGGNGYTGAEDTYIAFGDPDNDGLASSQTLRVGYKQQNAALLRFDLSSIPSATSISQASLQLYATGWGGANIIVGPYRILRSTSVASATWNRAQIGNNWATAGCNDLSSDRLSTPESSLTTQGINRWYSWDLTSLVQVWLNGSAANCGVLLRQSVSEAFTLYFASAEADASLRPKLVVTYRSESDSTSTSTSTPTASSSPTTSATWTTPTNSPTLTASPMWTLTPTPSATSSASPTYTATEVNSPTSTASPTWTLTPTPSATSSASPTTASIVTPTVLEEAQENTVTLQQGLNGYAGAEDTCIALSDPNNSDYASNQTLRVGYKQQNATLLRFDLSSIPTDATVNQASLQLYATGWSGSNIALGPYRVLRNTTITDATWNRAQIGNTWTLPGCNDTITDRLSTPASSLTTQGINRWYSWDLTSLVQAWLNGSAANYGVLLRQTASIAQTLYLASAEANASLRPRLAITYRTGSVAPTPTPSLTCSTTPSVSATPSLTSTGPIADTPTPTATCTHTPTPSATINTGSETTVTLQQALNGYAGAEDTYITLSDPNNSDYAWNQTLKVGYKQQNATLLRFDLSSIPTDATVNQASLQLYATGWSGSNIALGPYRVLRNTTITDATWNRAQIGNTWTLPGCNDTITDRLSTPASSLTTQGINRWYSWDLTSLVQAWLNGSAANYGVLLRQTASIAQTLYLASAEANASLRPRLAITYRTGSVAPTPTPSLTCSTTPSVSATPSLTPTGPIADTPTPTATCTHTPTPSATINTGSETTVTLQQALNGYAGAEDTYITLSDPNNSDYAWNQTLKVGYKQQNAALLRFDLSSIPADATVNQASLQLYATSWSGLDCNISVGAYGIVRSTTIADTTWMRSQIGNSWGIAGCNDTITDRLGTPESTVNTNGIQRWYAWNVTALVQAWINGSVANNGVLLRQSAYIPYVFGFASANNGSANQRPQLIITYYTGGVAATPTPTGNPDAPLVIGHITDAHTQGDWSSSDRLPQIINLINHEATVLIDSGDCTDAGTVEQSIAYREMMDRTATIPWRAVQGNHDTPSIFATYIGPLSWTYDIDNYRFIGINTEAIDYTALDAALTLDKVCIVVGHFPISVCNPGDQILLRQRLAQYLVPLYIAGHTHVDSAEVDPDCGTLVVTGQRSGMGHYQLITVRGRSLPSVEYKAPFSAARP